MVLSRFDLGRRLPRSVRSRLAVPALIVVLLVVLSALQYRWTGEIAEAERVRMQAALQTHARQMADEFDLELAAAAAAARPGILSFQADETDSGLRTLAGQWIEWRVRSARPGLCRDLLLVRKVGARAELLRLDRGGQWIAAEWARDLRPWESLLEQAVIGQRLSLATPIIAGMPAVVTGIPRLWPSPTVVGIDRGRGGAVAAGARQGDQTRLPPNGQTTSARVVAGGDAASDAFPFGIVLVWLDRAYIDRTWLPELVARHFPVSAALDAAVEIVSRSEQGRVLFRSDPSLPDSAFTNPDVRTTLFQIRQEYLFQQAGLRSPAVPRSDPDAGEWLLLVTHRAGSLELAAAAMRRRNLALALGVVALVGAGMAFVLVSARRVEQLGRQQLVFAAGVSHELRTPLTVIRTAGRNLARGIISDDAQVRRYGELVASEGQRLTELVEEVMCFAAVDTGLGIAARTVIDVASLVDRAIELASGREGFAGMTIERSISPDLPTVRIDVDAVAGALANLLDNASKYGGAERWVRIGAEVESARRGRVIRIDVDDRGGGIPRDEQAQVFEPFYRGRAVLASPVRGAGLGLSLVKRVAEAHGGSIRVHSTVGRGTTFSLRLPLDGRTQTA